VVFAVMLVFLLAKIAGAVYFESVPTHAFAELPIEQNVGNLEGKELRFGAAAGPLWAVLTTSTSNGSVNSMHDCLNPMTGLMPMIGMWLNATFGGVGVGMINMFIYIVLAVFVAGMMVGTFLSGRLAGRLSHAHAVDLGYGLMLAAALSNLLLAFTVAPSTFTVIAPAALYASGMALAMPNLSLLALDLFPTHRGTSSAVQAFGQTTFNAGVAGLLAPFLSKQLAWMAIGMLALCLTGFVLWRLARRTHRHPAVLS